MTMTSHEFEAWHAAERDVEHLKEQLSAMGVPVPEPSSWSTNPRISTQSYAEELRDVIRLNLFWRHTEEMRADLATVASAALLDQLDAAGMSDAHTIDAAVPVGLLRRLRELLA